MPKKKMMYVCETHSPDALHFYKICEIYNNERNMQQKKESINPKIDLKI